MVLVSFWIILASQGSPQQEMLKSRRVFLTGEVNDDMAKAVIPVGIPVVPYTKPSHCISHTITMNENKIIRNHPFVSISGISYVFANNQIKGHILCDKTAALFFHHTWNPHVTLHCPSFTCHRQQVFVQQLLFLEVGYLDITKDGEIHRSVQEVEVIQDYFFNSGSVWDTDWLLFCW